MLETPFEQYESRAIDELTRILGPHGFDAKRDVAAISVYRWGHGYAYGFNSLYDKQEDPELSVYGHQPVGRIAIANSDAAGSAYAHAAIEQGLRAVDDVSK